MTGISIKHLLGAETGEASVDAINLPTPVTLFTLETDGLLDATGPLTAEAHILRVEGGFEVELHDLQVTVSLECHTCLRPYDYELYVRKTTPVFFGLPGSEDTPDFLVDAAKARLPLEEWLRQEVLLALPIMQKCSRPDCTIISIPQKEDDGTIQPFADLKDLL